MTTLPEVIARYQDAHDLRDTDAALATFTPAATVRDDGHEYRGTAAIRDWLSRASVAFTYTRTVVSVTNVDANKWVVTNRLEGNFPGGLVDLQYRYLLEDQLIHELDIAP